MTKEIRDIVAAYKEAQIHGRQCALATVVHVEGSSYRRPGARMLVEEDGKLTGAISGGCLEGDALRKAIMAINQQENKLVTYDTTSEDDAEFGVQLGCNGIVHILFEPVSLSRKHNPVELLETFLAHRKNAVVATLFSLNSSGNSQPGTCFFYDGECSLSTLTDKKLEAQIKADAEAVLIKSDSITTQYNDEVLSGFIELLEPSVSLIIVGAGNDALPLVEMTSVLGWDVTVIDGRRTHATNRRFSRAANVIVAKPAEALAKVVIDHRTFIVLMTHNYNYDLEMMGMLLPTSFKYLGTLGPRKRLEKMLSELEEQGQVITQEQKARIFGPVGLDIGAETAEEIAISVLAEMQAVLNNRRGLSLRERENPIHSR